MSTIEELIREFIEKNLLFTSDGINYDDETSFLQSGIIDSASVLELVMFVEENFDISIDDSEITPQNFDSVSNLSNFIRRKGQ